MRLLELNIKNYRKISAARIRPHGVGVTTVGGPNSAGKTSALSAIWALIAGKTAIPPRPIKDGEQQCTITGDLGEGGRVEYRVTRYFSRDGEDGDVTMSLKVATGDGKPITSKVETLLKSLIGGGDIQFDPLSWARSKPEEQFQAIKRLVPGFDFEGNAAARQQAYDDRTDVNRQAKAERARADGIELPPGKPKAFDGAAVLAEYQRAVERNASIEREEFQYRAAKAAIETKRGRAKSLRDEADRLEMEATDADEALGDGHGIDPIDIAPLKQRILEVELSKGIQAQYERKEQHLAETARLEAESATLTERIERIDRAKAEAIAAAKIAVPGMSLGDNEVLLNGLPFEQAGTREKLVAAVAVAMLLNPTLRVITIDEGSEIDSDGLAILADLAEANEFDVLVARVDETGASDFIIQNGEMREGGRP